MATKIITDPTKVFKKGTHGELVKCYSSDFIWSATAETSIDMRLISDGARVRGIIREDTYGERYDQEDGWTGDTWETHRAYAVIGYQYGDKVLITRQVAIEPCRRIGTFFRNQASL